MATNFELTCVQDSMSNKTDYIELGLACAGVCNALHRGMKGKKPDSFSPSVVGAVRDLLVWVKPAMCGLDSSLMAPLIAGL